MMLRTLRAGALSLAALLLAAPAAAQDTALSEDEVRSFLTGLAGDIEEAMSTRDVQAIQQFTRDTIADGAVFMVSSELYREGARQGFSVANMTKEDLLRFQDFALSAMMGQGGPGLEDVSFDIEVVSVDPIGPNAATVTTRITESATLSTAGEQMAAEGGQVGEEVTATGAIGGARIDATSDCHHLIQRTGEGDALQVGLTTCQTETTMALQQR